MRTLTIAMALLMLSGAFSAAQAAQGERLLGCYEKRTVPAEYDVQKILVKEAERQYIKRNGRIELVEYPAVYHEKRTLRKESYLLLVEIPC